MSWRIKGHEYPRHEFNHFHTFLNHGLRVDPDLASYATLKGEELIKKVIQHYKKKSGFTTLIEKTPTHTLYIPEIKKRFPNAIVLHVYRHPLDVMASHKEYNAKYKIPGWDVVKAANAWNDYFAQGCFNSTDSVSYHGLVFSKVIGQQLLEKYNLEWNENTDKLYSTVNQINYRNWHTRLTKKEVWQASQTIDWDLAERVGFYPWE